MDYFKSDYLKSIYAYYTKKVRLNYFPPTVFIEPTNYCNFKCLFCPQSIGLKNVPKGYMNTGLYNRIINRIKAKAKRVVLHFSGESLLHDNLVDMIKVAKLNGLKVTLHTNASLLDEKKSYDIIDSGIDVIVFSFNGGEVEDEFEEISPKNTYKRVVNNIERFLQIKVEKNAKKPFVAFEVIKIYKGGKFHINDEFKTHFSSLGVNRFSGGWAHHWSGNFSNLTNLRYNFPHYSYAPCQHLWTEFVICWDGVVVACCNDALRTYPIGDIKKQTVEDLWNNDKMVNLRRKLILKEVDDIALCKNCDRLWLNKIDLNPFKWAAKRLLNFIGDIKWRMRKEYL